MSDPDLTVEKQQAQPSAAPARRSRVPMAYAEYEGDKQFATTLARGMELLMCFTPDRFQLANKELCQMLNLPKGTVSRLTYTLCKLGYLYQTPGSGLYALGSAVVPASYPLLANIGLRQLARPAMDELADYVGGSVSMGIRDRLNVVFVETSRSRHALSGKLADIGLSYPIAASAIGRAYLAACTPAERLALLNEIRVKSPEDWERYEKQIDAALQDFERFGFCVTYGELRPEIVAVGVPVPGLHHGRRLVFNCAIHKFRVTREQLYAEVGPRLLSMVRGLAQSNT